MEARDKQPSLPGFGPAGASPRPEGSPPSAGPGDWSTPDAGALPLCRTSTPPPESFGDRSVWVVDAHSLIHQLFHAMPNMTGPRGEPIGAVFGLARDLLDLLATQRPDYFFCAFDLPGKTFRHELYDQYKIDRPEMHEDLLPQMPLIYRLVAALGIPALGCESYEADDILATVARLVHQRGGRCFLVTSDKDCRQLLSDRVSLYNLRKQELFDPETLHREWGIAPEQVVDFQALVGDSVDNVPGVPLVGPKLASQLLQKYGTLENVLDHADEVSGTKRRENLKRFRDQALLSRRLVELDRHVPVPIDWQAGRPGRIDRQAAVELFTELGFRSLLAKLDQLSAEYPTAAAPTTERAALDWHVVDTPEKLAEFLARLREQPSVSVDTETTDIRPRWAELVGCSFAWNEHEAWYLPVRAPEGEPRLDAQQALEALRPVLEDPQVEKVGQNLKYDMVVLRAAGVRLSGVGFDTMVASYLLEAGQRNHNLDELARRYLGHTTIKIKDLIGSGKKQRRMDQVPVQRVAEYACEDAVLPLRLRPLLAEKLRAAGLDGLFADLETPLVEVLADLEYQGIRLDVECLERLSQRYGRRMAELEAEIYELAGRPLNIASPRQLQEVLFGQLKLPVVKRTTQSGPSTDAEVLEQLAPLHPLPARILEYRQYAKLKSTYVDALPAMVHPQTGRVHASFHQTVAATGRLSSSDPNLQNIPVRTREGREIRAAFVPGEPGWRLLSADYSQIELRILAHYSGDAQLCEAFARDEDIHARVAAQVAGVPLDQVNSEMRRAAKAVNFGVIYGQSPFGLARALGIEKDEAAQFIDSYFARYPGIEECLTRILDECRRQGYVTTVLGRRRAIRGVRPHAGRQRNLAERTAVNTVIQGSAADLIKLAMVAVYRRLAEECPEARMLLQIHDELIFEAPEDQIPRLARLVAEEMTGVWKLSVPLKVDLQAGVNWAELEPLEM